MRFTVNDGTFLRRYRITWRGLVLEALQVIRAENAARIFRRTMKPWALLTHRDDGRTYEAVSYPFGHEGDVAIVVRAKVGEPGELLTLSCAELRPIQFSPKRTGIPANDPIEERRHA